MIHIATYLGYAALLGMLLWHIFECELLQGIFADAPEDTHE